MTFFVAIGYSELNAARARKAAEAKAKGYALATYVSSRARLGPTRTGRNSFIMESTIIQPFVTIGCNCIVWCGSSVGHHAVIGDNCFLAAGATVAGGVTIGENCFLGINATIREHLKIGAQSIIGAGALIQRDAPPGRPHDGRDAAFRRSEPPTEGHAVGLITTSLPNRSASAVTKLLTSRNDPPSQLATAW